MLFPCRRKRGGIGKPGGGNMGNGFQLVRLEEAGAVGFKREMQKAFQYGYEVEFGPCAEVILPEEDIDRSLNAPGAVAYVAMVEGVPSGGAVVKIDPEGRRNHLELLFVKVGTQSRGVGQAIWRAIEELHPDTEVWETCTPYFEKRNLHFYINCCGFHVVEFFNPRHRSPEEQGEPERRCGGMSEEASSYFFRFEKQMNPGGAEVSERKNGI